MAAAPWNYGGGVHGGAVLMKFRPSGAGRADLLYASYVPGAKIGLDAAGHVYSAGAASEQNLPTTPDAVQRETHNDVCSTHSSTGAAIPCNDIYLVKLDLTRSGAGSLLYATYLGGHGQENVADMSVDASGAVYLTGT